MADSGDEVRFQDGNTSEVVRVGDTVRRVSGPWAPAVHALLRHLENVGFDGAPRCRGFDEQGREVLTFVEGVTIPPSMVGFRSDALLVNVARLLRRFHDAVEGFVPPPEARWRYCVGAPTSGDVIGHNDAGPWNVVVRGEQPVALIDWDFAAPAPRVWDVAYALWRFAPLYADVAFGGVDEGFGPPAERARRMTVFCDAYGLADRRDVLEMIERRIQASHDTLVAWAVAGDPSFVRLLREGHGHGAMNDLVYLRHHRAELQRHLDRR